MHKLSLVQRLSHCVCMNVQNVLSALCKIVDFKCHIKVPDQNSILVSDQISDEYKNLTSAHIQNNQLILEQLVLLTMT